MSKIVSKIGTTTGLNLVFYGFNTIWLLNVVAEPLSITSFKYGPDLIIWHLIWWPRRTDPKKRKKGCVSGGGLKGPESHLVSAIL